MNKNQKNFIKKRLLILFAIIPFICLTVFDPFLGAIILAIIYCITILWFGIIKDQIEDYKKLKEGAK